jgi:hypothetical protein
VTKPTWTIEVPTADCERVEGLGLRLKAPVRLEDAPAFAIPRRFKAELDDPKFPGLVTLHFRATESGDVACLALDLYPRVDRRDELVELDSGRAWSDGRAPFAYMGDFEVPVPRLKREAIARAGVPQERPLLSEMGRHVDAITKAPAKRAPRISAYEWALIRSAYQGELANPDLTTKRDVRRHVFELLHYALPDEWPRRDGRTPDYDRLRPFLVEIDAEQASLSSES